MKFAFMSMSKYYKNKIPQYYPTIINSTIENLNERITAAETIHKSTTDKASFLTEYIISKHSKENYNKITLHRGQEESRHLNKVAISNDSNNYMEIRVNYNNKITKTNNIKNNQESLKIKDYIQISKLSERGRSRSRTKDSKHRRKQSSSSSSSSNDDSDKYRKDKRKNNRRRFRSRSHSK